jgi:sensor histidine kinase YesM
LRVINSGVLEMQDGHEGFGLQSTSNRLSLIFGDKALFSITQTDAKQVEAKVIIPLN